MSLKHNCVILLLLSISQLLNAETNTIPNHMESDSYTPPPKASREIKKVLPTTEQLLEQDRIVRETNILRVNKIYKILRYKKYEANSAKVTIFLNEHGEVMDIKLSGIYDENFSKEIHSAIHRIAPFEMSKDPELNQRLRQIPIKFQSD